VVERHTPIQAVEVAEAVTLGRGRDLVPLGDEELKVLSNVGLELEHRLWRKGVGHELPLAAVLLPVPRVEEASADRDEGVVEVTGRERPQLASRWFERLRKRHLVAGIFFLLKRAGTHDFRKPLPWP
jgi:hypothetical protein